ncbi:hypothetical protein HYFRA_00012843 [Hymenoscyphus fraxineus]|uniref:Uncharacterized protein n=1 Tax=Hymenoscyphus fraxineus TaxID=746836 RepID=A0A9N9PYV0_9HELO|nr:hypothetical protein HYFRA_00012843 [Hymenoscyphus fraxineus]
MIGHTTLEVRTQVHNGDLARLPNLGVICIWMAQQRTILQITTHSLQQLKENKELEIIGALAQDYLFLLPLIMDGSSQENLRAPISLMLGMTCNRLYDLHWQRHSRVELIFIPPTFGEEEWKRQIRNFSYRQLPFFVQKYAGQTCFNRKYTIMLPARLPNDYRILFFPSVHKEEGNFGYEVSSSKALGGQALARGPRYNVEN